MNKVNHAGQLIVAPVLFIGLLALLFFGRPNWGTPPPPRVWQRFQIPANRAFIGAIDSKLIGQAGSYVPVSGWAAASSPTARVVKLEIRLNGAIVATVNDFILRADVAAVFDRPDFEWSGWRCVVSTEGLTPGEYELRVNAIGSDGSSGSVMAKKLTLVE